jgi:ferredoxin
MDIVRYFANQIYIKIISQDKNQDVIVKGNKPYRKYYRPVTKEGIAVDIRKVIPKTNSDCNDCKLCASICPMGSINFEDVSKLNGICVKCGACIKKCPTNAKYYDDADYLRHKFELENQFAYRREPELFI